MASRHLVYDQEELFAVVHAENAEQAILLACWKTARNYDSADFRAERVGLRCRCRGLAAKDLAIISSLATANSRAVS